MIVGSGALLRSKSPWVLTAAHVVERVGRQVKCEFPCGTYTGRVKLIDRKADAAAIILDRMPGVQGLRVSAEPLAIGEASYAAGYGQRGAGFRWIVGERVPSRMVNGDWISISGSARQGDSGGPVIRVSGDEPVIVGCLWGTGQGNTTASGLSVIRRMFKLETKTDEKAEPPRPTPQPERVGPDTPVPDVPERYHDGWRWVPYTGPGSERPSSRACPPSQPSYRGRVSRY